MSLRYLYNLIFCLFISSSFSTFFLAAKSQIKENSNELLGVDYLKKIPSFSYIIGPGDKLAVIVSRDYPELSTITTVDGEGTIYVPRLKRIYVNNLSVNELNNLLNQAYKKFVKYPSVEVEILDYRVVRVFLEGEIVNPGLRTMDGNIAVNQSGSSDQLRFSSKNSPLPSFLNNGLVSDAEIGFNSLIDSNRQKQNLFPTVFDAIQASGGITRHSDISKIELIRKVNSASNEEKMKATLNFEEFLFTGNTNQNIRVYDGDIIRIPKTREPNNLLLRQAILSNLNPKFLNVSVYGRVRMPGMIRVSKAAVLSDAIDVAGGTKKLKGNLTFVRFMNDGTIDTRKFRFNKNASRGSFKNPYLMEGDFVVVGDSPFSAAAEIINETTQPFVGIFSTYGLFKAIKD